MLIDDILANFESGGHRSYYSFETFILNLLKYHLESQDKKLSITADVRGFGDAIAEKGFDNFKGKTLIEVRKGLDRMPTRLFLDQFVYRFSRSEKSKIGRAH